MKEDMIFSLFPEVVFALFFLGWIFFCLYKYRSWENRLQVFERLAQELGFTLERPRAKESDELSEVPGSGRGGGAIKEIILLIINILGTRKDVAGDELKNLFSSFQLFKGFSSIRIGNILTKSSSYGKMYIFDGTFKKSSNRSYYRAGLAVTDERLDFPECTVVPENLAKKVYKLLGNMGLDHKDINLEFDPEFSSSYLVRGSDEFKVREVLNSGVCRWFVSLKEENPHFEGRGTAFVIYFEGGKLEIENIRAIFFSANEFLEMWTH